MFLNFLDELRVAGIPASLKEHLILLEAMEADVIERTPEDFYYLARATYVKDEGLLDRFDQVFAKVFKGIATSFRHAEQAEVPADWLKAIAEKYLSARRDGADQVARLVGRDHGHAQAAAGGTAGPAPGRQQVDRHRRHQSVR